MCFGRRRGETEVRSSSSDKNIPVEKVIFLGDSKVGKTSLIDAILGKPFFQDTTVTTSVRN